MAGPHLGVWEARLRAEGLAPIEDDGELNAHRRDEAAPGLRAEFWSRARQIAQRLPLGARREKYIKRAAELGNPHRAARELGLSKKAGEWAWRRFLVFAGLPAPLVKGSQGRKRPNRPGLVRIEAGRFREEAA